MGFLLRWAFAFILLAATYNPTDWNLVSWSMANYRAQIPLTILATLVLLVGYIIYVRATLRSIGLFGMVLILAVASTLIWVLFDFGWIDLADPTFNTWLSLAVLSLVLAIGLSWSIVRRKLSGQADVDDIDT
jgi:nitroreductase